MEAPTTVPRVKPSPAPADKSRPSFSSYMADGYWNVFGREWPPWLGGILLGLLNFALFAYAAPWFIYGGFINWGQWIYKLTGIVPAFKPAVPWLNTGSMMDIGIFAGAFLAIMAASNFRPRMPQRKIRLVEGFVGGLIMGVGAMWAPGWNIGGLFSAVSGLSLSGFVLFFGLAGGAWLGVLLARWRVKREISKGILKSFAIPAGKTIAPAKPRSIWRQPILALIAVLVVLAIVEFYVTGGHTNVAVYLLFGVAFGVVLERTGFCMTASFRDLFTSGGGRLARGSIVAIATAMIGFTILVATGTRQPFTLPVGWHTLVGGAIFGFGMVLAGGCATGTLFRIGEGNVQYMMALLGAIITAPLFNKYLTDSHFKFGPNISLITELGVQGALWVGLAFLFIWFLVVQWNEMRSKK